MYFIDFLFFIFFSLFFDEINTNSNNFEYFIQQNDLNKEDLKKLSLTNNLKTILKEINSTCINKLMNIYKSIEELEKIYEGSSKGFIDMSSFSTCIGDENNTFYSIYPQYSSEALENITVLDNDNFDEHIWIFGVCIRKNICNSTDIKQIFGSANEIFNNTFKLYNKDNINVDDFVELRESYKEFSKAFINLFPFAFILIQILFMIFKIIPVKLYSCCLRKKYISEFNKDKRKSTADKVLNFFALDRHIELKIKKCFSFSEIIDDISYSRKNKLFKDEDLTYIRGIKVLGLIFLVFGFSFMILYNYPLCLSEKEEREKFLRSVGASLLIISFRLSPALILSSSGYSLCYKFLNFLDKKLSNIYTYNFEENNDDESSLNYNYRIELNYKKKDRKNTSSTNGDNSLRKTQSDIDSKESSKSYEDTLGIKFYNGDIAKKSLNIIFKGQKINEKLLLSETSTNEIPCSVFFGFVFRQIHKFFCMFIGFDIFEYAFPILLVLIGKSPLMNYIYQTFFLKLAHPKIDFLFVGHFMELFDDEDNIMRLFFIPISEFNFFIICSIIIFICYKKNLRLDIIIIILSFISVALKIVYILIYLEPRNPGMLYTNTRYQKFFFNPLFNFDFYLIGMFFGIINYAVQNGITKKESLIKKRSFVKIPLYFLKKRDYHKGLNYLNFIFLLILMLTSLVIVPILFSINLESIIKKNKPDISFLIFSLIDIELFIISFYFLLLSSYISGRNIFSDIFNSHISSYGQKLSYWMSLTTPSVAYLIVYQNEANFNLSFFMVIFYGSIILFIAGIFSVILFITVEMPYKKLIKLFFNISAEINKVFLEEEINEEPSNNIGIINAIETLNEDEIHNNKEINGDDNNTED